MISAATTWTVTETSREVCFTDLSKQLTRVTAEAKIGEVKGGTATFTLTSSFFVTGTPPRVGDQIDVLIYPHRPVQ